MLEAQGLTFWWDCQLGTYCSSAVMGSLGQYITPAEIAGASGVTLAPADAVSLQAEFDTRPEYDAYTEACRLTRFEFISRFKGDEIKSILAASKVNADLGVYLWKTQQAQEVSLLDPETITGVLTLEAVGLLAAGRATQILRA